MILDSLIGDDLVQQEKIGAGNFFWSFPSDMLNAYIKKTKKNKKEMKDITKKNEILNKEIILLKEQRSNWNEREENLIYLKNLKNEFDKKNEELKSFRELRKDKFENNKKLIKDNIIKIEDFNDILHQAMNWLKMRNPVMNISDFKKFIGIAEDFDDINFN